MKIWVTAILVGWLSTLGLFWLMQAMLSSNTQNVSKSENLSMMDFVRLKPKQSELPKPKPTPKPEPKPKIEKIVEKVQKVTPKTKVKNTSKVEKAQRIVKTLAPKVAAKTPPREPPVKVSEPVLPKLDLPAATNQLNAPPIKQPMSLAASKATNSNNATKITSSAGDNGQSGGNKQGRSNASGSENGHDKGGANSGVVALERVQPKYPMRAINRHIEGKVTIQFTVSASGSVVDPVVISAEPAEIFDDAALNAISKWKFKQKIVDGKSVEQHAVQTLHFKLSSQ